MRPGAWQHHRTAVMCPTGRCTRRVPQPPQTFGGKSFISQTTLSVGIRRDRRRRSADGRAAGLLGPGQL